METKTIEFRIDHEGLDPATVLLGLLAGKLPGPPDDCGCVRCIAERVAKEPAKQRSESDAAEITKRMLLAMLKRCSEAAESAGTATSLIIEKPTSLEFDHAMLLHRMELFNANVRCAHTLAALLPASTLSEELRAQIPAPVTWEFTLENLEKVRAEVQEIVDSKKTNSTARDVGREAARVISVELANVLKEALRTGPHTESDMKAIVDRVTARAKEAIRGAAERSPTYPPPPPSKAATP